MGIKKRYFILKRGKKPLYQAPINLIFWGIYFENCCPALTFDRSLVLSFKINENCHCH
jgi:hypothetical protein